MRFYLRTLFLLFVVCCLVNLCSCTKDSGINTYNLFKNQSSSSYSVYSTNSLKKTRDKFKNGYPITIVCIGSSSTYGAGASTPDFSYPAQLSQKLNLESNSKNITVYNKGINGEATQQNIDRFSNDVTSLKPDLVIWQLGTVDAINGLEQVNFRHIAESGVKELKTSGFDVILIEPQYYPGVGESELYRSYVKIIQEVAAQLKIAIVPRYDLIRNEVINGRSNVLSSDQFHLSDTGYALVADYIVNLLK